MLTATATADDRLESSLNALYAKQFTEKEAIKKFAYLCDRQKVDISVEYRNHRLGSLLRKLDVAAFNNIKKSN
jgi:predicted transcriptional regulator of viral defense system